MTIKEKFFDLFFKMDRDSAIELLKNELNSRGMTATSSEEDKLLLYQFMELGEWGETHDRLENLKLILAMGADPNQVLGILTMTPRWITSKVESNFEVINTVLNSGADPNIPNVNGETALSYIVGKKDDNFLSERIALIKKLIDQGAKLNFKDKNENSVLSVEIDSAKPSIDIVKILIDAGADINHLGYKRPCLSSAIFYSQYDLVDFLLNAGADVNVKCRDGKSPLFYASAYATELDKRRIQIIESLIQHGAIIDDANIQGITPLMYAVQNGYFGAVNYLIQHQAEINRADTEGKSSLHYCCINNRAELVKILIDAGADIEQRDGEGRSPLMYALKSEQTTKEMLAARADVNALDKQMFSALIHAINYRNNLVAISKVLIIHGAKIDQANIDGDTALHVAIKNRAFDIVEALLKAGAAVNATNVKGELPLMLCNCEKTVGLLLKNGANVNAVDSKGNTAIIHLMDRRVDEVPVLKLLINVGINLNAQRQDGFTALMSASRSNVMINVVKFLVDSGVDLDIVDQRGFSATAMADDEILKFLITSGAKPNVFESSRLMNAIDADNIPMAIMLLERGIKIDLTLKDFVQYKKTLEKLARSHSEIMRIGICCVGHESEEQLGLLLAKFTNNEEISCDDDLPHILKKGIWPIKLTARTPLIIADKRIEEISRNVNDIEGSIRWPEGEKNSLLNRFKLYNAERNKQKNSGDELSAQEYFASLLVKKSQLQFGALFKNWTDTSEHELVKFLNDNAQLLCERIVVVERRSLDADHIAYLLARFDMSVLPGIIKASKQTLRFADALCHVDSPICAPLMAIWLGGGTASRRARQWALKFPESCTQGLIIDAVSKVRKARAVAEVALRFIASHGHKQVVERFATQFGADVLASVREILSQDPRTDFMSAKAPVMPKFWSIGTYPTPRLKSNNKALPSYAVEALANMMSMSNSEVKCPALDDVIEACVPGSLSAFAWGAFEDWAEKGKKDSEWIFDSLTYLGDDTCARKLTPFIRNWPRENGIAKARKGLEILAAIGTDVALRQIQAISQKNKHQSVLESAQEMMKVIATARDLTSQQLEDRLVPDLGLSESGELKLNFGRRHFIGSVDARLKAVIRDEEGIVLKALPSAGKDDDKNLAKDATAAWSSVCKELEPVAKLQIERLEMAMSNSRRWTDSEFKSLLVLSPLLQNVVKGLVWAVFSSKAKLSATFLVNAENAFVDAQGTIVKISKESTIGVVHPLLMGEESLAVWQKLFAKSKQVQPFAQLVRKIYRAEDDIDKNRFGLDGAIVSSKALKGLLAMGWHPDVGDGGWIGSFERSFASEYASLIAEPGMSINDYEMASKEQKLELSIPDTLNPMEFSELIRELMTLKK